MEKWEQEIYEHCEEIASLYRQFGPKDGDYITFTWIREPNETQGGWMCYDLITNNEGRRESTISLHHWDSSGEFC